MRRRTKSAGGVGLACGRVRSVLAAVRLVGAGLVVLATTPSEAQSTTSTTRASAPGSSSTTLDDVEHLDHRRPDPMVTATLPVVVCQTTSGVTTTTAALPGSVPVSVPAADAQQGTWPSTATRPDA